MIDPDFLELEEVLELHARQLEAFGGSPGIRDRGLLESALASPRATFGGDQLHLAALLERLSRPVGSAG